VCVEFDSSVECKEVFRVEVVVRDGWREFPVFVSRSGVRVSDVGWLFRLLNDGCEQVDMDVSTVYRGVVERIVFRCPRRVVDSMGGRFFLTVWLRTMFLGFWWMMFGMIVRVGVVEVCL